MNGAQKAKWWISIAGFLLALSCIIAWHIGFKTWNPELGAGNVAVQMIEGCQQCHHVTYADKDKHAPFGCTACHLGDATASIETDAHQGMIRIPGNLADAAKTCGICHAQEVSDIHHSLMTTNAGIVAVDRYVFGEQSTPDGTTRIEEIEHSAADSHLRNLCASCHLGNAKELFSPIDDASRGGGCNACHLNYNKDSLSELSRYLENSKTLPSTHPQLDLEIGDSHCVGCHSRSGRIAMNYKGFHETDFQQIPEHSAHVFEQLKDGRVFQFIEDDIHHRAGLACVDCHTYDDTMGDGESYAHEEQAVKVRCEDCHTSNTLKTDSIDSFSDNYQRIYRSRNYVHNQVLSIAEGSIPLVNSYVPGDGKAYLFGKLDKKLHPMKAPSVACSREYGHRNLSCSACHTKWAPQCIECHTAYRPDITGYDLLDKTDQEGLWLETGGDFRHGAPALGVFEQNESRTRTIQPAIPGMILTLDATQYPHTESTNGQYTFHRLFAPVSPHTISSKGRSCVSCHCDPVALGYGEGDLKFEVCEDGSKWSFTPAKSENPADGIPQDAWTGFMLERNGPVSTRIGFRPFNREEQEKILTVGACFQCHDPASEFMMKTPQQDFSDLLKHLPDACKLPFLR